MKKFVCVWHASYSFGYAQHITSYEQPVGPLFLNPQVNASVSVFELKDQVI